MSENRVRLFRRNGPGLNRNGRYNSNSNSNRTDDDAYRLARRRRMVGRYNSNSNSNSNSERRRHMVRVERDADNFIHQLFGGGNNNVRRRLFNDNNNAPPSPGRKPKTVNVSKYEKMLKNLENKNKNNNNNKNNKPNNENKNVVSWLNKGMAESKKSKIPKNKRVFLLTDLTRNGKIKHVWDRRFLNGLVESAETLPVSRRREVRENNDPFFTSPLTRNKFSKNDIKAYPPTNATKGIIKQIMNRRVLESKVNKLMKIKNKDYLARSNILETIKRGVRKGTITTEKQIVELALIYQVTGRELLISGHKKDGDYYTAYVKGKFKPHHIKFMEDAPSIVSLLYDTTRNTQNSPRIAARAIVPLYKLTSVTTTYFSNFEKYFEQGLNMRPNNSNSKKENQRKIIQQRKVIRRVLRQIVKTGYVQKGDLYIKQDISALTNSNLRNKLNEYYEWYELVRNASS